MPAGGSDIQDNIKEFMEPAPAFQHYPRQFVTDMVLLNAEEAGAIMFLKSFQWFLGGLPDDDGELRTMAKCSKRTLDKIKGRFTRGSDGKLRNQDLERYRSEMHARYEKQREGGRRSAEVRAASRQESQSKAWKSPNANSGRADGHEPTIPF